MTGITRQQAAEAVAALFCTSARRTRESRTYDPWEASDQEGKKWRFVYDASIVPTRPGGLNRANSSTRHLYHVEMNSPVLEYGEMGKLQAVVRALRRAGAELQLWDARPCGRGQPHAPEPEERPDHHVCQGGHPV